MSIQATQYTILGGQLLALIFLAPDSSGRLLLGNANQTTTESTHLEKAAISVMTNLPSKDQREAPSQHLSALDLRAYTCFKVKKLIFLIKQKTFPNFENCSLGLINK